MTESRQNADCRQGIPVYWSLFAVVCWLIALTLSLGFNQQHSEWLGGAGIGLMAFFALAIFHQNLVWNAFLVTLWGFWFCWLVAFWFSPVSYIGETTLWTMVALPISATATYWLVRNRPEIWSLLYRGLVVFAVALAVFGCYQFFVELQPPRGTFINKNNFAALLMMVLLVSVGRYIPDSQLRKSRFYSWALLASVFILAFVIGLIESRGATLALACGMVFVLLSGLTLFSDKRRSVIAVGVSLAGLMLASSISLLMFGDDVASLPSPFELSDDNGRFAIWSGSVEMVRDALPFGIGPGLFWLVYPQFRLPADASGGFYVHNDYLQFLIEAGPAAPLMFFLFAALITYRVFRFVAVPEIDSRLKMEAMVLFAALSALAGHSLLTFNLYLLPILIVAGALAGRLFVLLESAGRRASPSHHTRWKGHLTRGLSLIIIACSVLFYTKAIGGAVAFNKAMHLSAEKSWRESARHYQRALGFWDDVDVYHYSLAWALFEAERAESSVADYNYVSPRKHLDIAEELNPYRPQPHFLRARISHLAGTQQGGVSVELDSAITGYQRALELDPLYLDARFRLARILLQQNEIEQGLEVLERGLVWSYANSELKQQYYRLTAEIRRILGDQEGYAELLERSKIVSEALRHRATRDDKAPGLFQ